MITVIVILISLSLGSFANNVITHYSAGMPLDLVRSKCLCGKKYLSTKDLIPLVSYLLLKGKCRYCSVKIPRRYPIIELIILITGLLCYSFYGVSIVSVLNFLLIYILLIIGFTDLYKLKIPDSLTFILLIIAIARLTLMFELNWVHVSFSFALGSTFVIIFLLFKNLKGIEVIGFGDIKLLTVISLLFEIPVAMLGIWLASLSGLICSKLFKRLRIIEPDEVKIPFGFYLSLTFSTMVFAGDPIINYYIKIISGNYV